MHEDEIPVGRAENLTGKKYGSLTVLYRAKIINKKNKSAYWKCKCDCGNEIVVRADSLLKNITTHCGCLLNRTRHLTINIGDNFNKLTVIEKTNKRNNGGNIIYKCQCQCGNICYVRSNNLLSGETTSCGCINSKGELKIQMLLQANQIIFEKQKMFVSCRFLDTNKMARFDFFIDNRYLIEFDGEQHFKPIQLFGGEEQFKIQQERDAYKNQWCKDNNIPLIRIPYTKLDTLCIEDLMLETAQFRVV